MTAKGIEILFQIFSDFLLSVNSVKITSELWASKEVQLPT
jgi:hypothetical protein